MVGGGGLGGSRDVVGGQLGSDGLDQRQRTTAASTEGESRGVKTTEPEAEKRKSRCETAE